MEAPDVELNQLRMWTSRYCFHHKRRLLQHCATAIADLAVAEPARYPVNTRPRQAPIDEFLTDQRVESFGVQRWPLRVSGATTCQIHRVSAPDRLSKAKVQAHAA